MDRHDTIVIGAGHNGLVCAALLAKAGQRVLVLEAADRPGGLIAERAFHDDFRASVAHTVGHFPEQIAGELNLAKHGFTVDRDPLPTVGLGLDREHVVIGGDSVSGVAQADADAWQNYSQRMTRFADALAPFWLKTMPRIGGSGLGNMLTFAHLGFNLRRMGKDDMHEFLRIASLPIRDLMDETFEDDLLKATLGWDGLIGGKMAPRSPNGAVLALLYRRAWNPTGLHSIPAGGVPALAKALAAAAEAAGAEIQYGARVSSVTVDGSSSGLAVRGVRLDGGERIEADRVVSSADPKTTFIDLVGVDHLDIGFTNRIRRLRADGYVAKLHLALDGLPEFSGVTRPDGRLIIAPDLDAIEFAFDDAKYGDCPAEPVLEIAIPSLADESLAPPGKHVLSAHVMYVPRKLKNGWNDKDRDALAERIVATIARYAPGIGEQIIHRELLTPADIAEQYGVGGGHWHHAEFAIDQMLMMRPTYEAAQYATPIPGLWLCGAGSHPGGDVTGAAGHNAAKELLR